MPSLYSATPDPAASMPTPYCSTAPVVEQGGDGEVADRRSGVQLLVGEPERGAAHLGELIGDEVARWLPHRLRRGLEGHYDLLA